MCHCKFCQRRCPIFSVERDTKFFKISLLVLTLVMMGTSLQGKLNSSKYLNEFPSCVVVTLACDRVVSRGRDWHLVTSPGGRRSVGDWREGRGGARRRTEPPLSTSWSPLARSVTPGPRHHASTHLSSQTWPRLKRKWGHFEQQGHWDKV